MKSSMTNINSVIIILKVKGYKMKNYIICIIAFLQGSESTTLASFVEEKA
jgi:hypothetical protein